MLILSTFIKHQAMLLGLLASMAAPPSELEAGPEGARAPAGFSVEGVTNGGSGCRTSADVTVDEAKFRVAFHDMALENPTSGSLVQYVSCYVKFSLRIPVGWQVAPARVAIRGAAELDHGITARQTARYFFAGASATTTQRIDFAGPYEDGFLEEKAVPSGSAGWSPCGGSAIFAMNANLQLNAKNNPEGDAAVKTIAQRVTKWRWRKC
ncbi:DUF4360 domain-containing protein [Nannocystis punicea]|uniref:DUF4360 domain-containing protein n=1 Tax=Nannocystis punicea TaxID=2995304 RepID=A0ABY7GYQ6_9BACT|nr:DUF4360 domain-containing protein [Nannocystis poenicansa]WAS92101.1 DUF4360 domain-containing protein [Nannocystis poenicansa]